MVKIKSVLLSLLLLCLCLTGCSTPAEALETVSDSSTLVIEESSDSVISDSEASVQESNLLTHDHDYLDATCTEPKTCSSCGQTTGQALGHDWQSATCLSPKTCVVCGETEGETAEHTWAAATCTSPKTCTVCGKTKGDKNGHDWQAATCTTPKTCIVCGKTKGDIASHDYDDGYCTVCGSDDPSYVSETMVWIPKTGSKYHSHSSCSNMKNPSQVTKSQAISWGYDPCKKCYN